jgi:hypothetical protein
MVGFVFRRETLAQHGAEKFTTEYLTRRKGVLKYRKFREIGPLHRVHSGFMTPKLPPAPQNAVAKQPCKHPRVQIVSRDEESEFVECKECGEIFESSEFKDMNIEESTPDEA